MSSIVFRRLLLILALVVASLSFPAANAAEVAPAERLSLNQGWRFWKEPAGAEPLAKLAYDVRPLTDQQKRVDSALNVGSPPPATSMAFLKPWILPTANRFFDEPGKRHTRPNSEPAVEVPYLLPTFDDQQWQLLDLPHDWAIKGPFGTEGVGGGMGRLPSPGVGWYRRKLEIEDNDTGKSVFLDVDGAMSYAMVWVNGRLAGGWPYGFASWRVNLTPYLRPGPDNQLVIRLDNPPESMRWYPGGGIYRNVWLVKTARVHVAQWGTQITTIQPDPHNAKVNVRVNLDNDSDQAAEAIVITEIYELGKNGDPVGEPVVKLAPRTITIPAHGSEFVDGAVNLVEPKLWGPPPTQQPHQYLAVTSVHLGDRLTDRYETHFGVRTLEYKPDGFYINGERIRLQGVNQHHDLGALGAAFDGPAVQRQLNMLREMGCNAIRMAHNPPAPELLDMADRMGLLIMDEIFDGWVQKKTPLDFHLIFPEWHEPDLRAFMRRDRNHPSVIMWSVGNEVGEQYNGAEGVKVAQELVAIAHQEDSTRPATASLNGAKSDSPFAAVFDVVTLNYQGEGIRDTPEYADFKGIKTKPQYEAFKSRFPARTILSSESAAAVSTRGTYLFPVEPGASYPVRDGRGGDAKQRQVSAYELYAADFGSSADKVFAAQDHHPFVAGEFVWSGWDYLGEPSPYYASRSSYFGIIDMAGLVKDRYYLYQARWRKDLPMAHILPHWSWPERLGKVTPVHVFTSGDEAELFLNGRSLGRKKKGEYEYRLRWDDVVYEPGVLRVESFKAGQPWATDEKRTAGAPSRIQIDVEESTTEKRRDSTFFITATVVDDGGTPCPRSDTRISFEVSGPGMIVATDNGDPTNVESFKSTSRRAFSSRCVAIVKPKGNAGTLQVLAKSEGLQHGSVSIQVP